MKREEISFKERETANNEFDLETIDKENVKLVSLIPENVIKVETMLRYNSTYSQFDYWEKTEKEIYEIASKEIKDKKYDSSSIFYIKAFKYKYLMQENNEKDIEYKTLINIILRKINSENSTRASLEGINLITKRICENYTPQQLLKILKEPRDKEYNYEECDYELIECISVKTKQNDKTDRYNFSLATKFCHYMNFNIFDGTPYQDLFSIYDNVVKDNLKYYVEEYLNVEDLKKYNFQYTRNKIEKDGENNATKKLVDIYKNYQILIDKIIMSKRVNCSISRNGFDHLLWYTNKGIKKGNDCLGD